MLIAEFEDYTSVIFKVFEVRLIHIFHKAIQIALSQKIADFWLRVISFQWKSAFLVLSTLFSLNS